MPTRDQLFLLPPLFPDSRAGSALYYCPDCAQIEGVLGYFPFLRHRLEVTYVDFARPRAAIVALLGAEHQGCPVLVLAGVAPEGVPVQTHAASGRHFVAGAAAIATYLAAVHRTALPHP